MDAMGKREDRAVRWDALGPARAIRDTRLEACRMEGGNPRDAKPRTGETRTGRGTPTRPSPPHYSRGVPSKRHLIPGLYELYEDLWRRHDPGSAGGTSGLAL